MRRLPAVVGFLVGIQLAVGILLVWVGAVLGLAAWLSLDLIERAM